MSGWDFFTSKISNIQIQNPNKLLIVSHFPHLKIKSINFHLNHLFASIIIYNAKNLFFDRTSFNEIDKVNLTFQLLSKFNLNSKI